MQLEILSPQTGKPLAVLSNLQASSTIYDVKKEFNKSRKQYAIERQSFKLEAKGKLLKDEDTLEKLQLSKGGQLYFKDLGPQIGWKTVFLCEYAGPLFIYLWIYQRPFLFYGAEAAAKPASYVTQLAVVCWTAHYLKRLLETVFVHRFSHSTMPLRNLFKNSVYYWGFSAYVAYYINHPLYTPPACKMQVYGSLILFTLCEIGNFSIHWLFRGLRPEGSKERKIPFPSSNPFTYMFNFVSCPNYTYEIGAWLSFTIMTQCLPAGMFALAGFYQMAVWALGKHRQYRKEFNDYPRGRKSIVPFIL